MLVLASISMLAFIGICSAVGLRLLWLARRIGGVPVLACGLGFTLIGLLGYPLTIASRHGVGSIAETSLPLFAAGSLLTNLGVASFLVFTWRVFRPADAWARALVAFGCSGLGIGVAGNLAALGGAAPDASSFEVSYAWNCVLQAMSLVCFGWTSLEAMRELAMARRRLALGMGDPVVADRFRRWMHFGVSTTLLSLVFAGVHLAGIPGATSPIVHVSSAVFGLISSFAIYLAFLPPRAYLAHVRRRAAAAAAG